jgi:hypothetical protein
MRFGDPDRRHRVGLQDLVDPGLAADAAAGRCRDLIRAGQQLRGFAGDRRKHVLDLVEQQRRLLAALEEDLRDLQRAVAVAAAERVAVAVGVFHLEQLQAGCLGDHLGQLGLAGARRPVQQHVDAGRLARHRMAQQRAQHLRVFRHEAEIGHPSALLLDGRVNTAISSAWSRYSRISTGGSFLADLHQVGQVGDVVLGDQVLDQADALQPRAGPQAPRRHRWHSRRPARRWPHRPPGALLTLNSTRMLRRSRW